MSLNPQCYANKPAGITDANTKAYTGLNSCLNSCKNGLRATYWARNMVSRLKWSWTGCMADLLGRKCNSHLPVLVCDAFELWCWHNMWSGGFLRMSRLFSAVLYCVKADQEGYYHTAEAAASGLTKRKQREAAASKAATKLSFCPNGWTACLIPGGDKGSYEVCSQLTRCI